ncbi:MAG TPA: response regulator transcription factor [Solirubrobacteraceae bacterium]
MFPFLRLAPVPDSEPDANPAGSIRIILADDHAAMRQSLRLLLDGEADIDVIAETDSLSAVIANVHARRPDVLVLDLGMSSRGSGVAALDKLSREMRDMSIVVLTMSDDPVFAQRVLDNGACGLVLKEMADSDLPAAVRAVSRGQRYLSPLLAGKLNGGRQKNAADTLTPREREVLRLIALGYTSVEIAQKLGLSPRTIETHRARIHRKLNLETRAQLVRYAMQHELMEL